MNKTPWFKTGLWGSSIALSWMWGLGLFFSVQFTHQFGLFGLLTFAIPNGLGLILFGAIVQVLANRNAGTESLANFFNTWARPFRLIFFLYQLLALTLTVFAIIRYLWQPLNLEPNALYLPLTILIVLASGCLFGEEFNIKRIKYSHGVLFAIMLAAISIIIWNVAQNKDLPQLGVSIQTVHDLKYWGYAIPICIGLLLGPWLDLQQWQRAIQIHRENLSVARSYLIGGSIFFLMLLFHGLLALWGMQHGAFPTYVHTGAFDGQSYAEGMLTGFLYNKAPDLVFSAYAAFICICILTTLDSGYIALRWFLTQNLKTSKNFLFSLVPEWLIASPIPTFILAGFFTLIAVLVKLELEYFMIFYATFFVGYAALGICRSFLPAPANAMPQIKMFCIGSLAVVIFSYGYFLKLPLCQILGSLLPLGYIAWLLFKPDASAEFVTDSEKLSSPISDVEEITSPKPSNPTTQKIAEHQPITNSETQTSEPAQYVKGGYFEGKWFVHRFISTYADTNSVGNVYFGMYAMWVGKTRELFFNYCMPKFNIKTSPYYILTRSFQHKFVRETREFEEVQVKIKVANFNRKFVTLAHEIYDSANQLLGKGEQSLMFVTSSDYSLIDIPQDLYDAFIQYA
jgi:acyl-CoA thioesterase FadM